MLDKWFLEDIQQGLKNSGRFVVIDPARRCGFLIDLLKKNRSWKVFDVHTDFDELSVKYTIEKNHSSDQVIVYTTREMDDLTFIREYCATGGYLNIGFLHRYINQKVSDNYHFVLNTNDTEIIGIGKLSIGKQKDFWDRVRATGGTGVFMPEDLLKFLVEPEATMFNQSAEETALFLSFLEQFCEHSLEHKPPKTIAIEFARWVFDNLIYSKKDSFLDKVYKRWIDSVGFRRVLDDYLNSYSLPEDFDLWQMPARHPFKDVDKKWLSDLIDHLGERIWVDKKLPQINERAKACKSGFGSAVWWQDIHELLVFNAKGVEQISNLSDAISFYMSEFYKIDTAVRHLYTVFLSEKDVIQPLQEYYEKLLVLFLDKWFEYFDLEYAENQTDLIAKIIDEIVPPVAIIIGDAIAYEVGKEIINKISNDIEIDIQIIRTNYPSDTDHNMSALFGSKEVLSTRDARHRCLDSRGYSVEYLDLDSIAESHIPKNISIIYTADIDQLSEKKNQGALKYYSEYIETLGLKIEELFELGYKKIYLTSDHGFVITGLLSEANKIDIDIPESDKHERYILSKSKVLNLPNWMIEIYQQYKGYPYQYYSKTIQPFKTKGAYGFAHGGISPQELLVPLFTFEKKSKYDLKVKIMNKDNIKSVAVENFEVQIQAESVLFDVQRKVVITLEKNGKELARSDIITLSQGKKVKRELLLEGRDAAEICVLDAVTKETLDKCVVKLMKARDLGGLGRQL